jgi:hypothetical protein
MPPARFLGDVLFHATSTLAALSGNSSPKAR